MDKGDTAVRAVVLQVCEEGSTTPWVPPTSGILCVRPREPVADVTATGPPPSTAGSSVPPPLGQLIAAGMEREEDGEVRRDATAVRGKAKLGPVSLCCLPC